jgi:predicted nucleic acid-binding protein
VYVIDSSAVVDVLLGRVDPEFLHGKNVSVPHLIDSEVLHVLRKFERLHQLSPTRARQVVQRFGDLPLTRYSVHQLIPRIWELRHNLTGYDATYVALAEAIEATSLLTSDVRLTRVRGVRCAVELV